MRLIRNLLVASAVTVSAHADVVETRDTTLFGKITSLSRTQVVMAIRCDKREMRTIDRALVRSMIFDKACRSYSGMLPTAGMQPPCDRARLVAYEVTFTTGGSILGEAVNMNANGRVNISLGSHGSISGPRSQVLNIVRREVCPELLDAKPSFPPSFCFEPFRPVVNFGVEPIFNNQVFTRGFTVFVTFDAALEQAERSSAIAKVTQALRTATLIWVSLLQENRARLPERLRDYLGTVVARSEKYQLVSSPGVTEVDCPSNAMIVVNWMTAGPKVFPRPREYLAKAQVQGRTILINARDFRYRWDLRRAAALEPGEIDLITVMLHEFGHSLGLEHAPEGTISVMSSNDPASMPTSYDFAQLVAVLERNVRGAAPGDFNLTYCSGLRPGGAAIPAAVRAAPPQSTTSP
jgi:hypothetical protein